MGDPRTFDPNRAPFEEVLSRLGGVVAKLEAGELPLEDALVAFEEGVALARAGATRLDDAERRVELLLADAERVETRPLNVKESVE